MPDQLLETATLAEALAGEQPQTDGRIRLRIISEGWGSSGYYSRELLEAAAAKSFPAGTHMFLDHPTPTEDAERPVRSVKDLAAVLETAGSYSDGSVFAEARVFGPYQPLISELREAIGVSVRAPGRVEIGEAEGRTGPIVAEIGQAFSVDFVTRAGRGGQILELLESALPNAPLLEGHGMTANDLRDMLRNAVSEAHGGDKRYVWLRDYTDDWLVFELESDAQTGLFQQSYSITDGAVVLAPETVEVSAHTTYVPVGQVPPAQPAPPAPPPTVQEDDMPELTEAERTLREATTRAEEAEARATASDARADAAERALAEARARDTARPIVAEVMAAATTLSTSIVTRVSESVVANAPLTAEGTLDEAALRTAAETARTQAETEIAELFEAQGVGTPRNLGGAGTPAGDGLSEAEFDKRLGLTNLTGV